MQSPFLRMADALEMIGYAVYKLVSGVAETFQGKRGLQPVKVAAHRYTDIEKELQQLMDAMNRIHGQAPAPVHLTDDQHAIQKVVRHILDERKYEGVSASITLSHNKAPGEVITLNVGDNEALQALLLMVESNMGSLKRKVDNKNSIFYNAMLDAPPPRMHPQRFDYRDFVVQDGVAVNAPAPPADAINAAQDAAQRVRAYMVGDAEFIVRLDENGVANIEQR